MASGPARGLLAVYAMIVHIVCNEAQVSLPFQCSFESDDLCGMRQRTDDLFDWTRLTGPTPSRPGGTGPYSATDGDYYIYIEGSYHGDGDRAIIETPPLRFSGAICVQFWYHMYTRNPLHMGRLVVFTGSQGEVNPLFDVGGVNKGDQWILEQITVTGFQYDDKIVFLNEERNAHQGDMALDMIDIQDGVCDACSLKNGGCDTHCVPDGEGRRCECDVGYLLDNDGLRCFDIDECVPKRGKGDCGHQCDNTPGSYRCDCDSGYTLNGDQQSCDDINECSGNGGRGPCDVTCENNPGRYMCSCPDDQHLQNDGTTCADCQDVYRKQLDASQAFTSLCPTIETYLNVPLATCLINACADNVSVVVYDSNVCSLKLCTGGNLQVEKAPGSSGWDIYVLDTTWTGPRSEDASSFPLWQLLTGLFVGAAALGAIITVVTVCIRKRISSGSGQGRTPYENAETITRHETTVENTETITRHETTVENTETQPEGGVYEDVISQEVQKTRGPNDV